MRNPGAGTTTYWDTASSEPLHPAARELMAGLLDPARSAGYADPRRLHGAGRSARLLLDNARAATAEALGCRADEVSFTASGTEAVHRGLLGLLAGRARAGATVAVSAVEHACVGHAVDWWRGQGAGRDAVTLPVDRLGRVDLDRAPDLVRAPGLAALAVQAANHEVGTVQPVGELARVAAADGVPVFVDACAAMGRIDLPPGWAVAVGSAHKWGGPAGVGVLLVRRGVRWRSAFPADDRVDERVAGFENLPAVLAAAAALQAVVAERDAVAARQRILVDRLRDGIAATVPDVEVVGDPVDRLPHLLTASFLYVDGEALVTELDRRGLAVASGSACTTSDRTPSHVLAAMEVLTHGNLRVSLTRDAADADVDRLLAALPDVVATIRAEAGL